MADARQYAVPHFELVSAEYLDSSTPSRREGMHPKKEESLLWEATLLLKYAADQMKLCVTASLRPDRMPLSGSCC
jgi:hypothetical protein